MDGSRFWIRGLAPAVLIAIAWLHTIVGVSDGWQVLREMAGDGWFRTIRTGSVAASRPLLFWFLVSGYLLFMIGHLALWIERRLERPLPAFVGWELLVFTVVAGVLTGGLFGIILFGGSAVCIILGVGLSR